MVSWRKHDEKKARMPYWDWVRYGSSHSQISFQARSFTALCIGTTVFMSAVRASYPLRFMASKNIFSEGYTQFPEPWAPDSISWFAALAEEP